MCVCVCVCMCVHAVVEIVSSHWSVFLCFKNDNSTQAVGVCTTDQYKINRGITFDRL